ncbi:hypothetical protein CLHUN_13090 [Ruminiclostridium hungatei]|uniref:Uncharacterized protein n=1 Tax=Ruminiclostridium hungatei TaxID=48256 RepID=A0A1V4SMR8_RUMHU|nr:hypothetical protein CLHUN_13090 [Ruminiclostridium hungatei]
MAKRREPMSEGKKNIIASLGTVKHDTVKYFAQI